MLRKRAENMSDLNADSEKDILREKIISILKKIYWTIAVPISILFVYLSGFDFSEYSLRYERVRSLFVTFFWEHIYL